MNTLADLLGREDPQLEHMLGISQMHVSRLRARALGYLCTRLLDLVGLAS